MPNVSKVLPDGPLHTNLCREVGNWSAGLRGVPHEFEKVHEQAAKADIDRLMAEQNCTFAASCLYVFGDGQFKRKFLRIFADCNGTGRIRDFFWSDGNNGGWHWKVDGMIRRSEPPAEGKIYL